VCGIRKKYRRWMDVNTLFSIDWISVTGTIYLQTVYYHYR